MAVSKRLWTFDNSYSELESRSQLSVFCLCGNCLSDYSHMDEISKLDPVCLWSLRFVDAVTLKSPRSSFICFSVWSAFSFQSVLVSRSTEWTFFMWIQPKNLPLTLRSVQWVLFSLVIFSLDGDMVTCGEPKHFNGPDWSMCCSWAL